MGATAASVGQALFERILAQEGDLSILSSITRSIPNENFVTVSMILAIRTNFLHATTKFSGTLDSKTMCDDRHQSTKPSKVNGNAKKPNCDASLQG